MRTEHALQHQKPHAMHIPTAHARPLYLQNGSAQRLGLDNARRLCIERKNHPERRIPLHHISRIVCSSTLDISTCVIVACMESGIPLSIIHNDGTTLGWCLGVRRKETSLRQLLIHALDDPDWPQYYDEWLHNQKSATAVHTLLLCGVATTASARHNPRAALCNAHFQKHQQACAQHVNALAQLAQHELAALLSRETGAPHLLAWYRPGLNLMNELGEVLSLHAHTDLHHSYTLPDAEEIGSWAVRHYERHAAHWQQRMSHLMYEFEQFLRRHWL